MARMRLVVTLDVDLKKMGAEYGLDEFKLESAREYLTGDIHSAILATPYADDALSNVEVK